MRNRIAIAAYNDVVENCTTYSACIQVGETWRRLLSSGPGGNAETAKASVAFVVRAPIAVTGGGYKKIFRVAKYLLTKGYHVRVHVEAIAHLEGKSDAYIKAFCNQHFDVSEDVIFVGHDNIGPVDIAVATNWPTAPTVAHMHNSKVDVILFRITNQAFMKMVASSSQLAADTYGCPWLLWRLGTYLCVKLAHRGGGSDQSRFVWDEAFHLAGRQWERSRVRSGRLISAR